MENVEDLFLSITQVESVVQLKAGVSEVAVLVVVVFNVHYERHGARFDFVESLTTELLGIDSSICELQFSAGDGDMVSIYTVSGVPYKSFVARSCISGK